LITGNIVGAVLEIEAYSIDFTAMLAGRGDLEKPWERCPGW